MTEAALRVENVTAGYVRDLPVLRNVSVTLDKASIAVIIGPNGAGKSTLIKAIAGLVPITSGTILLGDKDVSRIRPDELAKYAISYVPQNDNIFRTLTIRQNLELVLRKKRHEAADRLNYLFARFPPLEEKQHEKAGSLSGGQRQMLAVAMALATRPSIILMDEPSAGLSPKAAQEVLELAKGLTEHGVSILLVEQNVKQSLRIADHCYILAEGRNQLDGKAADLLRDPMVGEIYLGGKRTVAT
jgi:ABC-type branched-subunit amino acid transport system ATPase component